MSSSYNSSPYFQVDQDVMNASFNSDTFTSEMGSSEASGPQNHNSLFREQWECNTKEEEGELHISVAETPAVSTDTSTIHGPQSAIRVQTLGRCCRELLKEIQDLTYLSSDKLALESLKQSLHQALNSFRAQATV